MDSKKAKKAVKKSKDFQKIAAQFDAMQAMEAASQSTMQPSDGLINPYGRIGTVPPTGYTITNQINGFA